MQTGGIDFAIQEATSIVNAYSVFIKHRLDANQEMRKAVIEAQDYSAIRVAESFVPSNFSERDTTPYLKAFPPKMTKAMEKMVEILRPTNQARK